MITTLASPPAEVFSYTLVCAVADWVGPERTVFGRTHSLLFALLRTVDPERAAALHDSGQRKPWALGPLQFQSRGRGLATLAVEIACWDRELAMLLADACSAADSVGSVHALGHAIQPIDFRAVTTTPLEGLLPENPASEVAVRFVTPTLFGLGQTLGDMPRYGLLPQPGLVVGSWMRAWAQAGGPTWDAPATPEWWDERLILRRIADVRSVTVPGGKAAITGFLGHASYVWSGPEPWGRSLLAGLAAFSRWCGTGAKTGLGFGQTRTESLEKVGAC